MEGYRGMEFLIDLSHHAHFECIFYATRLPLTPAGNRPAGGKIPSRL
jgi:hypothetical protein